MKFLNFKNNRQKGISSIVGGIFFLVLMTSGFTVYYVAIDTQSQMLDTQQIIADTEVAKIKEKFVVAASSDSGDNNRLSLQVVNIGNNAVEIADVWIINKTGIENATRYDLDYRDVSIPVGYSGNILENTPLYLISDIYGIKVISSIGTIKSVEYDVAGGSNILNAQMVAIPQDVRFGENVTVILMVTNTGEFDVKEVRANTNFDVSPNQCQNPPNLIFGGPSNLAPSQSTMFFWDCILNPPIGNVITFTGNATGLLNGVSVDSNDASDSVVVRDFTSGGSGEEIVLKDELFGKPAILTVFPNPVDGQTNTLGVWGVNVANPTDQPLYVSKVVIVAVSPRATSSDKIFEKGCESSSPVPITIPPTPNKWTCPESNQLMWRDTTNPQRIEPRSVFPFLVKVQTDNVGGTLDDAMHVLITPVTFSTLGQFGKAGYLTSQHNDQVSIPNVFLTRDIETRATADIMSEMRGIISGNTVVLNATIANMDDQNGYAIHAGAQLIINIPKEWNTPTPLSWGGFDAPITVTSFPDGSAQIIGNLTSPMTWASGPKTIQFSIIAPTITTAKLYVMHMLADGTADGKSGPPGGFTIGPLSENVLQVCPTTGGPQPECPP